ncbi:MAG: hypothetical protein K2G88_02660 [Oscillospiraceae bacterium]|nr:hypothetical protein [Oscillospiraceae bacterium]
MQDLKNNDKIKFVCELENNNYQQKLYINQVLQDNNYHNQMIESAEKFLQAFSPEKLIKQISNQYGENFVLVFRTTAQQMQNFHEIITKKT